MRLLNTRRGVGTDLSRPGSGVDCPQGRDKSVPTLLYLLDDLSDFDAALLFKHMCING